MSTCAYCDQPAGFEIFDDDEDGGVVMVCEAHRDEYGLSLPATPEKEKP